MLEVLIASDHAGYSLKKFLQKSVPKNKVLFKDLGCFSKESCDYPDFADLLCLKMKTKKNLLGVLICGSGQGMMIRANRYPFIRACLAHSQKAAKMAKRHNDSNLLCLGARFITQKKALQIFNTFMREKFESGRHQKRVLKLGKKIR